MRAAKARLGRRRSGRSAIRLPQRRPVSERLAGTPYRPPRSSAEVCAKLCWLRVADSSGSAKEEERLIECARAGNLSDRQCFLQASTDHGHSPFRHTSLIETVLIGPAAWVVVPLPPDRRAQGKDFVGIPARKKTHPLTWFSGSTPEKYHTR